jgi:hypothetical protein
MELTKSITTGIEINGYYFCMSNGSYYRGCTRCGGTGHHEFNGYDSICYKCNNNFELRLDKFIGSHDDAVKDADIRAKARAKREAKKEAARLAEVQKMVDKQEDLKTRAADVHEFLMAVDLGDQHDSYEEHVKNLHTIEKDPFIRAMAESIRFVSLAKKPFTDNMIAATRKAMERKAAKAAESEAHPVETGRIVLTGEIIGTKVVEGDYGTAYKITLKDDRGFRVYGSLAKALVEKFEDEFMAAHLDEDGNYPSYTYGYACWFLGVDGDADDKGIKGRRITFTATVEASSDDKGFGFFSRPTKAELA